MGALNLINKQINDGPEYKQYGEYTWKPSGAVQFVYVSLSAYHLGLGVRIYDEGDVCGVLVRVTIRDFEVTHNCFVLAVLGNQERREIIEVTYNNSPRKPGEKGNILQFGV